MRFFFYGTLMDADIRVAVLGRPAGSRPVEPATLAGYRRVVMRGATYPVAIADPAGRIEGCLMRGLDRAAAGRLSVFEGDDYVPVMRDVITASGRAVSCCVFVAGRRARPSAAAWDLAAWQRRHKRGFQRRVRARTP